MLTALASPSRGCSPLWQPTRGSVSPLCGNTTNWRAGCGRPARPVRRGEGLKPISPSYPDPRTRVVPAAAGTRSGFRPERKGRGTRAGARHLWPAQRVARPSLFRGFFLRVLRVLRVESALPAVLRDLCDLRGENHLNAYLFASRFGRGDRPRVSVEVTVSLESYSCAPLARAISESPLRRRMILSGVEASRDPPALPMGRNGEAWGQKAYGHEDSLLTDFQQFRK